MRPDLIRRLGAPVDPPATLRPSVLRAVGLVDRFVAHDGRFGRIYVAWSDEGVSACMRTDDEDVFVAAAEARTGRPVVPADGAPPAFVRAAVERLDDPTVRRRLRLDLRSLSPLERAVLTKTAEIPPGELRPYRWVAAEIGRPSAVRAVGSALGRNPVPLLIPCHRVMRSDGRTGDYAWGGDVKRAVLAAEGVDLRLLDALAQRGVRFVGSDTTTTFCHPTCGAARRIAEAHRVTFRSADEAREAGFRACDRCRPDGPIAGAAGVASAS